ncbi:MAG TPA: Gfo/Idh/MocA family oxidoreductase [Candidatus Limnocylindria bacterium]|jgi:glucose-fructose oxidoreductase|nr:Gfo/Idh/MocA family oxidoreductase [Candidatus Limnocylindria bacterium]
MKKKIWRVAGINFDHFHMGDLLRVAAEHPQVELVGISDEQPGRMTEASSKLGIPADRCFTDYRECLEKQMPDVVILCPAASKHGEWVKKVAPYGPHMIVEKPFAATLKEADTMIKATASNQTLMINWPLQWMASHRKAFELIEKGVIGEVLNVWHSGGNRGPLWHGADKDEKTAAQVAKEKPGSWFYKKAHGGGSLLDYLGYGTTLGTWFQKGRRPIEVTAVVDEPAGLEVDEHSIVVARYAHGLSKFETRWGTFTDPWTIQPQPRCGFVIAGTEGTIGSYDYDPHVTVQTRKKPTPHTVEAPATKAPHQNPIQYLLHCLDQGKPLEGPVSLTVSRIGQEIVDAAVKSAATKKTVKLSES